MSKAPTLLIDGDILLFRNTVAVEREVRWDEENHILFSNENDAWAGIERYIKRLAERFEPDVMLFALTQGPNFRLAVDPTYKGNRADQRKPLAYTAARERLEAEYTTMKMPGLEADDVMGILATKNPKQNTIIVSMDKDMRTIPCTLFNEKEVRKYSREEADYWHLYQTLIGDTSDGYPGCPGVGPVKAEKILAPEDGETGKWLSAGHVFKTCVVHEFEKAGLTEEDALRQARLARILRASDWDSEKKEPILWTPN